MGHSKTSGILLLVCMLALFLGMSSGSIWAQESGLKWHDFEDALQLAEKEQKPILVDVWAPWCGWCKKMQQDVYPELSSKLSTEVILTRLNRDDNRSRKEYQQLRLTPLRLAQKLKVQQVPAIVFLSPEGEYLFHLSGYTKADRLTQILDYVASIES